MNLVKPRFHPNQTDNGVTLALIPAFSPRRRRNARSVFTIVCGE